MPIRSTSRPTAAGHSHATTDANTATSANDQAGSTSSPTPVGGNLDRAINPEIAGRPSAVFTGADDRPEFRISVRPAPGQTNAPKPALMHDWADATVNARAKQLARTELLNNPQVQRDLQTELGVVSQQAGRDLTDRETNQVVSQFIKPLIPASYGHHYQQLSASPASRQSAIDATLNEYRPRMVRYKDPFTPVAQGDPAARARETMLWEDQDVMVMVDTFCPSPKALVVPKDTYNFPADVPQALMDKIADVSAKVSDAFSKASGSNPADIWINPPQRLTIGQLHVHVQPKLPHWEQQRRPRGVPPDPALVAEQKKFYQAVTTEAAKLLGPGVRPDSETLENLGLRTQ